MHREGRCVCRSFGSAWLCLQEAAVGALPVVDGVFECGARGCATPLALARGPRCKTRFELSFNSFWHVVARHSTFCQDTVQDMLLWLHPCGPTVDRLRRSTVGSGTREDVVIAYVLAVLHEVVYIAPVSAVIAAPALAVFAAFAPLVEYSAPARQVAAQSGVQHVESGHEAVCEQREWLAHLPGRVRAIGSSVAAVSDFVGHQREAGIGARHKTVEVFVANANPPLGTTSAQAPSC